MSWSLSDILDWVKILTPKLMLSVCVLSAVLLYSPVRLIASLGLTFLRRDNLQWIGLAFVVSASLLVGHGAFEFLPKLLKSLRFQIRRKRRARALSVEEKRVIQSYIHGKTRTQRFNGDSCVISGLIAYGFVLLASQRGDAVSGFPFNITDWAYRYFVKHPKLVDTPGIGPWDPSDGLP